MHDTECQLRTAIRTGDLEEVRRLLRETDCQPGDWHGGYLREAARAGSLEVLEYLVEEGGDPAAVGGSVLREALLAGHLPVVLYLSGRGVVIEDGELDGGPVSSDRYLWPRTEDAGHQEMVQHLQRAGLPVPRLADWPGVREAVRAGDLAALDECEAVGYDLWTRGVDLGLAAASAGRLESLQWLSPEGRSWTEGGLEEILLVAAREGHLEVVQWCLELGADSDEAFTQACRGGQVECAKLLAGQRETDLARGSRCSAAIDPGHMGRGYHPAVCGDQVEILDWLVLSVPPGPGLLTTAVLHCSYRAAEWFYRNTTERLSPTICMTLVKHSYSIYAGQPSGLAETLDWLWRRGADVHLDDDRPWLNLCAIYQDQPNIRQALLWYLETTLSLSAIEAALESRSTTAPAHDLIQERMRALIVEYRDRLDWLEKWSTVAAPSAE